MEFQPQHEEKVVSSEKRANDKERVHGSHRVACFDIQPALPTPPGDTATFYYASKLLTYNFAVCELQKERLGDAHCYLWNGDEGKKVPLRRDHGYCSTVMNRQLLPQR